MIIPRTRLSCLVDDFGPLIFGPSAFLCEDNNYRRVYADPPDTV